MLSQAIHRASIAVSRGLLGGAICLAFVASAAAFKLVTEQEAALPDDPTGVRGVTRGPDIIFVSPSPKTGLLKSPLHLKVRFKAHGGARIDPESVLVTYRKLPAVDVTQRLTPYIRGDIIEITSAEIPPGTHRFRFDVKDSDGRGATDYLVINVAK